WSTSALPPERGWDLQLTAGAGLRARCACGELLEWAHDALAADVAIAAREHARGCPAALTSSGGTSGRVEFRSRYRFTLE
ncbi:MAG TPA: hypothetical protein VML96_12180, partial [Egibacteraceae bacterium]|nr:hypothetical protein [Egibacteraceae bacterium]